MLNLLNPEDVEGAEVLTLVKEFRRLQVSRFPINVDFQPEGNFGAARFIDSRFSYKSSLGRLSAVEDEKGDRIWTLTSRAIINPRFIRGNERRHQKQTKDPKKMLRYLREFIKPYAAKEIAEQSFELRRDHVDAWKREAQNTYRGVGGIQASDVFEELRQMKLIGYTPRTEKFVALMNDGLPAWEEYSRRTSRSVMNVHVFINPDDSVEIFCSDKMGYRGITQGTTAYMSMNEAPQCIQESVAILRMMEDKAFVAEVGTKVDERNYWVEVFPE